MSPYSAKKPDGYPCTSTRCSCPGIESLAETLLEAGLQRVVVGIADGGSQAGLADALRVGVEVGAGSDGPFASSTFWLISSIAIRWSVF